MGNLLSKRIWLVGLIFLTLLMIFVGGVTRMTRSGLSITEWKPITGIIPPIGDEQWESEFKKYQATEEYKVLHRHFQLEDFKRIFFLEYVHRLLGRFIFLYSLLLGLVLLRQGKLKWQLLCGVTGWIAFQGLVGWWMVKSGLGKSPTIHPLMLAAHFFMALALLSILMNEFVKHLEPILWPNDRRRKFSLNAFGALLLLQIFYGALTSGTKAGLVSDTFPLMHGELVPHFLWQLKPLIKNVYANPFLIQWVHRWLGMLVLCLAFYVGRLYWRHLAPRLRGPLVLLLTSIIMQVMIGIMVILFQVPIAMASIHQVLGSLVFVFYLNLFLRLKVKAN